MRNPRRIHSDFRSENDASRRKTTADQRRFTLDLEGFGRFVRVRLPFGESPERDDSDAGG